jgi:cyclic pyranopterin phosphate synthase
MTSDEQFSHLNEKGEANMVDVSAKSDSRRVAVASARVRMRPETLSRIMEAGLPKGDVLAVARVAGIQGAKRCAELIPLCHPLPLNRVQIDFAAAGPDELEIRAEAAVTGKTGVEMEALTGASIAALTVYDMCKAVDREMVISDVRLERKSGGRHGDWARADSGEQTP